MQKIKQKLHDLLPYASLVDQELGFGSTGLLILFKASDTFKICGCISHQTSFNNKSTSK